jgi:predicted PurR-regulated permease PerM
MKNRAIPDMIPPSEKIQSIVFGVILILLFIGVCVLFAPFFTVLLWSTMFYVLFKPLHRRIVKNMDFTTLKGIILKKLLAGVFAVGTVALIFLLLFFVSFQFYKQIVDVINLIKDMIHSKPGIWQDIFGNVSEFLKNITAGQVLISVDDIQGRILTFLSSSIQYIVQFSGTIAGNVGGFIISLFLIMFCLFFFYSDGAYLSQLFLQAIPIRKQYLTALLGKFTDSIKNLFLGYIMVALFQAFIGYIIYLIFQIKGALVFAMLTFICLFIPIIGSGIVWIPLGIARIVNGDLLGGIIFLIVSGFFISTLDNVLRPIFLQKRIHLHPLIIFLSVMGGIITFGFNGLILGPMLVILFLTVLNLFLIEHNIERE